MKDLDLYPAIELVKVIDYLNKNVSFEYLEHWHYHKLFNYVLNLLKNEEQLGLRNVDDWSIKERWSCKCQDCDALNEFLQSSTLKTIKWPMGKERRQHIHNIIDGLGIPVLHQTEHTGSPHKLILTKTEKLYEEARRQFNNLKKALTHLALLDQNGKAV